MVTRIIFTEFSPRLEAWLGQSWSKILALGLTLVLAGIFVLAFPVLVSWIIALGLFSGAFVTLSTAWHLWKMSREGAESVHINID